MAIRSVKLRPFNGTLVNGTDIGEIELQSGDVIRMGEFEAEFLIGAKP